MVSIASLRLPGFTPASFFKKLSSQEKAVAYFTSGPWIIIAWNPRKTVTGKADTALLEAKKSLRPFRRKTDLPFVGGAIGCITYDAGLRMSGVTQRTRSRHRDTEAYFHVYDSALLFNGKKVVIVGDKVFNKSVREIHARPLPSLSLTPIDWKRGMTFREYAAAFRRVMKGIRNGDFYQLNLTYPFGATTKNSSKDLFAALLSHHPASASAYLEHGTEAIISVSPERFVLIERGVITASPIKGTRSRGSTHAEDQQFMKDLLRSPKEQAELNMITDLLRNDIGKVSEAGSVHVRGYRLLQKNPSVWHTYSVIEGALRKGLHSIDAFLSMFPSGSITGCPKISAMETIDRLELCARGAYCGSAVMLSASGRLDSTVLIRTLVKKGDALSLGVGGGIVADSVLSEEFAETEKKAQRILSLPVRHVWVNGREVSSDPRLRALDPADRSARGVFETMRVQDGRIFSLAAHLRRLKKSAKIIGLTNLPQDRVLRSAILKALAVIGRGPTRLKLVLSSGDVLIETRPLDTPPSDINGIAVSVTDMEREHPEAKALPYHREWSAYQTALTSGYRETLLRRTDGGIPEAAISNLFYVKRGTLFTPRSGMLKGVTRAAIVRYTRKKGIPLKFLTPTLSDLQGADEVFLSRSLVGVVPVLRIGSRKIGSGTVGRITRTLQKMFSATVESTL